MFSQPGTLVTSDVEINSSWYLFLLDQRLKANPLNSTTFSYPALWLTFKTGDNLDQAPVVQKVDSAIQRINLYPVDSAIGFPNTYPPGRDLSGG